MSKKLFFLPILFSALALFVSSCGETDPCKDVECGTNGTCFEGDCVCDQGYELDANNQCGALWQTKFIGTFNTSETCVPAASGTFSNTITAGSSVTKIIISNFGDSGVAVSVDLTSSTEFTVPATNVDFGGTVLVIEGSGSINGNVINMVYTIKNAGVVVYTCTDVMTRV